MSRSTCVLVAWAFLASPFVMAGEPTYWQDVRPVLRKHCTACHNHRTVKEDDVSGGLALDTLEAILKGGQRAATIVSSMLAKASQAWG